MKVSKITKGIVDYLKIEGLTDLLPEITAELAKLVQEMETGARIESARELSILEKNEIKKKLESEFKWNGKINYIINEEIIAGIKLTLSDKVLDMSAKGKLNKIYEQI
jgi:F0F1-type ATP synthase delta subunit